jgi:hypothetical protein
MLIDSTRGKAHFLSSVKGCAASFFSQFLIPFCIFSPSLCAQAASHPGGQTTCPLRVSDNGRYFVAKSGAAFLYHADTGWSAPSAITPDELDDYLNDRYAKGFTAIQMWAVSCDGNAPNKAGEAPFTGTPFDMQTVNEAYFSNIDSIIRKAEKKSMLVVIS